MPIQENSVWTKFAGGSKRHRRLNSKFPSFVTRGRNHAALVRPSANYNRFATQLRPLQQFHGNKKRIHIHMQNSSFGRQYRRIIMLRSKSRQLRHAQSLLRKSAANNRRNYWVSWCETQGRSGNREGERRILPETALESRGYFPSRCSRPSLQSHIPESYCRRDLLRQRFECEDLPRPLPREMR